MKGNFRYCSLPGDRKDRSYAKKSALKFVRLLLESLPDAQVCGMCGR